MTGRRSATGGCIAGNLSRGYAIYVGAVVRHIDLNADLGEEVTDDAALLAIVTSANVACGYHAGTAAIMRAVCEQAAGHGVSVGAQVSYDDREHFGRVARDVPATCFASRWPTRSRRSPPSRRSRDGGAVRQAARRALPPRHRRRGASGRGARGLRVPPVLGMPGALLRGAERAGRAVLREGFPDRGTAPTAGCCRAGSRARCWRAGPRSPHRPWRSRARPTRPWTRCACTATARGRSTMRPRYGARSRARAGPCGVCDPGFHGHLSSTDRREICGETGESVEVPTVSVEHAVQPEECREISPEALAQLANQHVELSYRSTAGLPAGDWGSNRNEDRYREATCGGGPVTGTVGSESQFGRGGRHRFRLKAEGLLMLIPSRGPHPSASPPALPKEERENRGPLGAHTTR